MGSPWFPAWLSGVFAVAFAVMLVAHVVHASGARGWSRGWHGAHVLMAAGMLDMSWPGPRMPVSAAVAEVVFWIAALAVLVVAVLSWTDWRAVPWAWFVVAVDLGAMAYMFALPAGGHRGVTIVLAGWLVVESLAWTLGRIPIPTPAAATAAAGTATTRGGTPWAARARLSAMGVGMAYMLLAMQFGMSGTGAEGPADPGGGAGTGHHHHEASAVLTR